MLIEKKCLFWFVTKKRKSLYYYCCWTRFFPLTLFKWSCGVPPFSPRLTYKPTVRRERRPAGGAAPPCEWHDPAPYITNFTNSLSCVPTYHHEIKSVRPNGNTLWCAVW